MSDQPLNLEGENRSFSPLERRIFASVCALWSLFQIWYASPLPFWLNFGILNDAEARYIHLAFSLFLIYFGFCWSKKRGATAGVPVGDWVLALCGVISTGYLLVLYSELAQRPGNPTTTDLVLATVGIVVLLEAARRAVGAALVVVAGVFIVYALAGAYMPEVIAHKGASWSKIMSHQWLTSEGVFGVALGVSVNFVFLFVLFGAMLESAGAGSYFIKMAFSLLGHLRGGPAKAAVVASGLSGIISGSSIANVVTTGNFTIPLMKKVGFKPHKAAAVEVAASTNGQLTPPIMGAAAFLMVEYVGIPYTEVIKHAILPALISYISLIYIVHLEACKNGLEGLTRNYKVRALVSLANTALVIFLLCALSLIIYYGFGWLGKALPDSKVWIMVSVLLASYLLLVYYSCRFTEASQLDLTSENLRLPPPGPIVKSGLYYFLPIVVLLWCMAVERLSPGSSAFYSLCFLIFICFTHRPLQYFFAHFRLPAAAIWQRGWNDFLSGLVNGGRNMIGIGAATAVAGIIVGTVTLTGLGQHMIALVEALSANNLLLMLLLTAVICLILGMGLPTTANYIVISTLMAPVIVTLGAQQGLIVPLIAAHMFVFYFGILADDTPPVGLAAYAGAAIAQSDPIKTGVQGFSYDIRTAILPFMFIFNTELLLIGIGSWFSLLITITTATVAMLCFASATQGFWLTRLAGWQRLLLLLVTFSLFRPDFWLDQVYDKFSVHPGSQIETIISAQDPDQLRLKVEGETIDGTFVQKTVILPLSGHGSARDQLEEAGLQLQLSDKVVVESVGFGSLAEKRGIDFGWLITHIEIPALRPDKNWFLLPPIFFLAALYLMQRQSRRRVAG